MKKNRIEHPRNVRNIFQILAFKGEDNPLIMGSSNEKQLFPSDYDLFEVIYTSTGNLNKFKTYVKKRFQSLGKIIKSKGDLYLSEFKAGIDPKAPKDIPELLKQIKHPLIWDLKDLIKGKKGEIDLKDILDEKSIISIEVVSFQNNEFVPYSNVFEFRFKSGKGINRDKETRDSPESLKADIKSSIEKKKYWKALKRSYILAKIEHNSKKEEQLKKIFDSDIGLLSQIKNRMEAMKDVLETHKNKELYKKVNLALNNYQEKLSNISSVKIPKKIFDKFNVLSKRVTYKASDIKIISDYLNTLLQNKVKNMVASDN